ncbi:MAG: hypothetical protein UT32_C0010G0023 [Parcubacteria group bacterium GW2011_GWC2_39_14]|nr:MAG: hypothetical protein UT32_C0010G0023 [Parcubacteria group bacterium GW2011_GWC2_39_14]KKR55150.1 MAG: hypothetical protein UT91_C0004G0049 [Parcubacteria group bacterium GW2011_GWA2_40_23]
MDIISHGLWGGLAFGRKNKLNYFASFLFGIMPDMFSFGILSIAAVLGLVKGPNWGQGIPSPDAIPAFVHTLYNLTHSLITFILLFGIVWVIRRKPYLPMLAWGLHILVDIPTHSFDFFPTPFLEPLSSFMLNGISWGHPIIFYPNVILLIAGYVVWWTGKRKKIP